MARGDKQAEIEERANIRRAAIAMRNAFHQLPPFDIGDPVAMEERCQLHMDVCMEMAMMPTLGSLAMALGCPVSTLRHAQDGSLEGWCRMKLTKESGEVLRKTLSELEGIFNAAFEGGAYSQPVTGIFAAKNNYGWRDTREVHEIVARVDVQPEQIAARYADALPMHRDPQGEVHRLQEGISARAATKAAVGLEAKLESDDLAHYEC